MTSQTFKTTPRGQGYYRYVVQTSFFLVKGDMEKKTPEQAAKIWKHLEPYLPIVASQVGRSSRGREWHDVLKKMQLVEARSKEPMIEVK